MSVRALVLLAYQGCPVFKACGLEQMTSLLLLHHVLCLYVNDWHLCNHFGMTAASDCSLSGTVPCSVLHVCADHLLDLHRKYSHHITAAVCHTLVEERCRRLLHERQCNRHVIMCRHGRKFQFFCKYYLAMCGSLCGCVILSKDVPVIKVWSPLYVMITVIVVMSEKVDTTITKGGPPRDLLGLSLLCMLALCLYL